MNILPPRKVPEVVRTYLIHVKQFIKETEQYGLVGKVTGPAVYNSKQNWSVLFNAYPSNQDVASAVFERLIRTARQLSIQLAGETGEIISASIGKGEIRDQGKPYFEITRGHIFECYQYADEWFAYIRVFQEKKTTEEEVWISFDMDFLEKSAWFKEKVTI